MSIEYESAKLIAEALERVADAINGLSKTHFDVFASPEVGRALEAIERIPDALPESFTLTTTNQIIEED